MKKEPNLAPNSATITLKLWNGRDKKSHLPMFGITNFNSLV
jgi:hypothetical protein